MSKYAFEKAEFIGDDGSRAILHQVALDFEQKLEPAVATGNVALALVDGELKITGRSERVEVIHGELSESGEIIFETPTSDFGVKKLVTIRLNHCRLNGRAFEAMPDQHGNVFTLSTRSDG